MSSKTIKKTALPLCMSAALTLTACSVHTEKVTIEEQVIQAHADHITMFANQEPVTQAITLEEAMARAIKYNLKQRLVLMEEALQKDILASQSLKMLPSLAASAGWYGRDSAAASSSKSITTGEESLETSTSQDRHYSNAGLEASWNVLDFGLGYFNAKTQSNKLLSFEQQRRRIVANIIQQVRTAYWQAATAQRLHPQVQLILVQAKIALNNARQTQKQQLVTPLNSLRYQKSLLLIVRQLELVKAELATAKSNLASLMNLPPATNYLLTAIDDQQIQQPILNYNLNDLEMMSMVKRPEISEEAYKARNAVLETQSAMLRLLPGASLFVGTNYNSNSYLAENNWADAGLQVSWNLLNLLSYPSIKRTGEAREKVAEIRRQALRMTVLTQVNVAWLQYQRASKVFARSSELQRIQNDILIQVRSAVRSDAQTELEQIRINAETVLVNRTRDQNFAQLQTAYGALYQAAGLDALGSVTGDSISELSQAIAVGNQRLELANVNIPYLYPHFKETENIPQLSLEPVSEKQQQTTLDNVEIKIVKQQMWSELGSLQSIQLIDITALDKRKGLLIK